MDLQVRPFILDMQKKQQLKLDPLIMEDEAWTRELHASGGNTDCATCAPVSSQPVGKDYDCVPGDLDAN